MSDEPEKTEDEDLSWLDDLPSSKAAAEAEVPVEVSAEPAQAEAEDEPEQEEERRIIPELETMRNAQVTRRGGPPDLMHTLKTSQQSEVRQARPAIQPSPASNVTAEKVAPIPAPTKIAEPQMDTKIVAIATIIFTRGDQPEILLDGYAGIRSVHMENLPRLMARAVHQARAADLLKSRQEEAATKAQEVSHG